MQDSKSPWIGEKTVPVIDEVANPVDFISYRNPEQVEAYLTQHPDILPFIEAAWPALVTSFDGPVALVLEVITYPYESSWSELVAWIQSSDSVDDALAKLEQFEETWFLDNMTQGFNFNLETR